MSVQRTRGNTVSYVEEEDKEEEADEYRVSSNKNKHKRVVAMTKGERQRPLASKWEYDESRDGDGDYVDDSMVLDAADNNRVLWTTDPYWIPYQPPSYD